MKTKQKVPTDNDFICWKIASGIFGVEKRQVQYIATHQQIETMGHKRGENKHAQTCYKIKDVKRVAQGRKNPWPEGQMDWIPYGETAPLRSEDESEHETKEVPNNTYLRNQLPATPNNIPAALTSEALITLTSEMVSLRTAADKMLEAAKLSARMKMAEFVLAGGVLLAIALVAMSQL